MARTCLLLCLLLVSSSACGDAPQAPPPNPMEALARQTFDALKHDDVGRMASAFVTADDVTWMMDRYRESAPNEKKDSIVEILEAEGGAENLAKRYRKRAEKAFRTARRTSAQVIDWDTAEFGGLVEEQNRPVLENGVEHARVHFLVRSGEREELFVIERAVKIRGLWATMRGVRHQHSPHSSLVEAQILQTRQRLKSIETVIHMFRMERGRLPTGMEELFEDSPGMKHPYLKEGARDAWGHPFTLTTKDADTWEVRSSGPDGEPGTLDDVMWPDPDEAEDDE